ncbi:MAG: DUF262 domain-containing protein, partial [Chloroflexi bacterium]|nr:DUF262 domain-containing protein [Chloroflexota bacterium]
ETEFTINEYPELENEPETSENDRDDKPVSSQPFDWTISTLREKIERGQIDLNPAYQRNYVWGRSPELPSRLIESLLLEIPIPPMYFGKMSSKKLEVIDGQQRLHTLIEFVSNKFKLQRLQRLGSLNDKYFRDLSEEHQAMVLDATIHTIVIDAGNNHNLRYEVFERLNRGSIPLNEQELRNCVYRGPFCDLLAELEKDPLWRKIKGGENPEPRFLEREMILRFFAFANRINHYTGRLKSFLNEYMAEFAPKSTEALKAETAMFHQTLQNLHIVFGQNAGRLYNTGTEDQPSTNGKWDTRFSISAFDIQASALMTRSPDTVQRVADQIEEAFIFFLLTKPQIRLAISRQPAGKFATKLRWSSFRAEVEKILSSVYTEPRFFSSSIRQQLYDDSKICAICRNRIHAFEDCTVDHILPYTKGGKTILANAQIAHRSCNAQKYNRLPEGNKDNTSKKV